ncbi:MAG: DUF4105 domain-containing protein [Gemmatimonadota bacterium]
MTGHTDAVRARSRRLARSSGVTSAVAAALLFLPLAAGAQSGGDHLRVWLVTAAPGDQVWERYGHNALRVLDTQTGRDVSYNWGIFDFQQVDFIPRFLRGEMLYTMAAFDTEAMLASYRRANREVVLQELAFTSAQKLRLVELAETNLRPENAAYIYQYFLDNCSTRIRDLLDTVLDGALQLQFTPQPSGTTYRDNTRRLTQVDPLIYTGMDLALGTPTDAEISVWEQMFLPMTLRDEARAFRVVSATGGSIPFVLDEQVVVPSTRAADPTEPPRWLWLYLGLGIAVGVLFGSLATSAVRDRAAVHRAISTLAVLWSALGGVLGLILVGLLFTDHTFAYWNENLFLVHPLLLVPAIALPVSYFRPGWARVASRAALLAAALGLVGLVVQLAPQAHHQNGIFFALLLPAHLGLAYGLLNPPGRTKAR